MLNKGDSTGLDERKAYRCADAVSVKNHIKCGNENIILHSSDDPAEYAIPCDGVPDWLFA